MQPVTLEPGKSQLVTVQELLTVDFHIPPFQRPYDWGEPQVTDLVRDLADAQRKDIPLFLGLVVVCPDEEGGFGIIDGQQRLTTLMLAIAAGGGKGEVVRPGTTGLSTLWVSPRKADIGFAHALLSMSREAEQTLSQRRMVEAFDLLRASTDFTLQTLLRAQVIVYVAPSLAGATGLFERINLRGKDVSQFDLVKNKLIEWAAVERDAVSRRAIEGFITSRYNALYRRLDPSSRSEPFDSDKLLRAHWILFTEKQFKSSDRVLEHLDAALNGTFEEVRSVASWIERYLNSLVEVAEAWVAVERPYETVPTHYGKHLKTALLDFARLGRDGELQPLIVAAIVRWRDGAADLVKFCEISSFRSALAKKNSNHGRSFKWRVARELYQGTWVDACGELVSSSAEAVHQLYWRTTPYWNKDEAFSFGDELSQEQIAAQVLPDSALDSSRFYAEYRHVIHYLFWKYGVHLPHSTDWAIQTREDINPFQDSVWFGDGERFKGWDIEHIYPQSPDDQGTGQGRTQMRNMSQWLNHLGNLTVLPIRDNRGMKNVAFTEKLAWLRDQRKVSFNELLANADYRGNLMDRPHWGINNCRKRVAQIRKAAAELWGHVAVVRLGVGPLDARVPGYEREEDEEAGVVM